MPNFNVTLQQYKFTATMVSRNLQVGVNNQNITIATPAKSYVTATQQTYNVEVVDNGIISILAPSTVTVDKFNGDGVTTVFQLTAEVTNLDYIEVTVGGVEQTPDDSFTFYNVTGTNTTTSFIEFSEAPPIGIDEIVVKYFSVLVTQEIQGAPGPQGAAGGVYVGTVNVVSTGDAYVHNVGNAQHAILNFGLPGYGPQGRPGNVGAQGAQGFQGYQGSQGSTGTVGAQGAQGLPASNNTWANLGNKNNGVGPNTIILGRNAGQDGAGGNSVLLGPLAGVNGVGVGTIAIGFDSGAAAGNGDYNISIGDQAGSTLGGNTNISIGAHSGWLSNANNKISIGERAGQGVLNGSNKGDYAIAIGAYAGEYQNANSIAIGGGANGGGQNPTGNNQGSNSIAIGTGIGTNLGTKSIAIGNSIASNQPANSIAINSSNDTITVSHNGLFIKPLSSSNTIPSGFHPMYYNPTTGEVIVISTM